MATATATTTATIMLPVVLVLLILVGEGLAQNDFSDPITCYRCKGDAVNSSCADPIDVDNKVDVKQKECDRGICLKWTKYEGSVLQMYRSCSSDLHFQLTMIDGICRTERNGNGWLCMCGKHLCNAAPSGHGSHIGVVSSLGAALVSLLALAQGRQL